MEEGISMRQTRLVLMGVGGVLLLCVLALVVSLADYTSHPTVAVAHVPPVVAGPASDSSTPAPSPVPTMPVAADLPTPTPAQRVRGQLQAPTLAEILQQLEQRRHHRLP
jgi:hypothetical protein